MSGISAARRGIPPELRLRCREATAREGRGGVAIFFWGIIYLMNHTGGLDGVFPRITGIQGAK